MKLGNDLITLQGDPSLHSALVSLKSLLKTWENEEEGLIVEFGGLHTAMMNVDTIMKE